MKILHTLSIKDRNNYFEIASADLKLPLNIVEKDYWVVWVLEHMFSIKEIQPYLTFKGGTSLSKVYKLIDRFSEDVDLSIEKKFFGFINELDPGNVSSKKKKKAAIDELSRKCTDYVINTLLQLLQKDIELLIGTKKGWRLFVDEADPDQQTLQFEYPTASPKSGYIRPSVKIELGARSEHWPVGNHFIHSYAKESLKEKILEKPVIVKVLDVSRTFWEKATILHQYAHLPSSKPVPARITRHYYDFYQLLNSSVKTKALQEMSLLERVLEHKKVYFSSSWASYETAVKGTLKLSPKNEILENLKVDYKNMEEMFFGVIPEWEVIINHIKNFETEFNR